MKSSDIGKFYRSLFQLEDKVAVVIGGTGALCGEMARGLWRAGSRIVLVGRNRAKAEQHFQNWNSTEEEIRFIEADVTQLKQVKEIIPQVIEWFGNIDIWINGAAIAPPIPFLEITEDQFAETLDSNLKSVHLGCQAIGRHWIENGKKGSIINLSSMSAIRPLSRAF